MLTEDIFSHDDMEKAIEDINSRMDEGWAISKDDIFNVYEDAAVEVISERHRLRLIITLPIYDHKHKFDVYKVTKLPTAINGSIGFFYDNLPDYLAISKHDGFLTEMSGKEIENCQHLNTPFCKYEENFETIDVAKSCAFALLSNNKDQQKLQCIPSYFEWKGMIMKNIADNQYAYSAAVEQEVIMTCTSGNHQLVKNFVIPKRGVLNVPINW